VLIRAATPADHAVLLDMMEEFNRAEHIEMRREVTAPALTRLLTDDSLGLVLIADDRSAYAVLTWGFDLEFGGRDAFLTEVYVSPSARRTGLGRALMASAITFARSAGAGAITLGVYPENTPAVALYEGTGFEKLPRAFYTHRLR
jgi:ribosomal protein S18 acetylase RimI-like enzyme